MEQDASNKPPEQKPPDLEERVSNWLRGFLQQKLGPRAAAVILTILGIGGTVWHYHEDVKDIASDLYAQFVERRPLPKADPNVFTVAIARLEDDNEQTHIGPTIVDDLQELGISNGLAVLEFPRIITADSQTDVQAGQTKAREWLKESGAQVPIWGKVLTANGKSVPQLYWTMGENSNPKKPSARYVLGEDLQLPPVFQSDLSDILRLLVVTQSSAFYDEEGHFVADKLRPFIERVRGLLDSNAAKTWSVEDVARTNLILADAMATVGN